MVFDATFWVAISFIIFFGVLIYLKVPLKINENLNKLISDIKNELNESEKLRKETKVFLNSIIKSNLHYILIYPNNDHGSDIILNEIKKYRNYKKFKSLDK